MDRINTGERVSDAIVRSSRTRRTHLITCSASAMASADRVHADGSNHVSTTRFYRGCDSKQRVQFVSWCRRPQAFHTLAIRVWSVIAKFHYTDPTGPARTFLRRNSVGSVQVADKVRARSGRVRVMEFSFYRMSGARTSAPPD